MGIKSIITKAGNKAADKVAKLSVLSQDQLKDVQKHREEYLMQEPSMDDEAAEELTSRYLAASSVEILNEYLNHIHDMYVPIEKNIEYGMNFREKYNIRYFEITKWVTNKKENSLEKLVNVYEVLSNEACNIALIFHRTCNQTNVFLAVTNTKNADDNVDADNYKTRLVEAIKGNFPGAEVSKGGAGVPPCMNNSLPYSVACASNIPGEKSEKFVSQTIEKLLDGIVPVDSKKEYTLILLATPISDVENRKIHLAELYTGLAPYAGWETNFTFTQADSVMSSATFGVNVGASAGIQQGQSQSNMISKGTTDNESHTETDSESRGETDTEGTSETTSEGETKTNSKSSSKGASKTNTQSSSNSHQEGHSTNESHSEGKNSGKNIIRRTLHNIFGGEEGTNVSDMKGSGTNVSDVLTEASSNATTDTVNSTIAESMAKNVSKAATKSVSKAISNTVGKSVANTLGRAVSNTVANTSGIYKGINLGANVGANFARASNVTATVGKNEGIVQHFINYNIKHLLENLEMQMKRYEQSKALGMWDFAAYVLSEDQNVANNVAYSYLALTQGEKSYLSQTAVNLWRGDLRDSDDAKEICSYIRELRHPIFALNPDIVEDVPNINIYPATVTATTSLSGKELAYSLNFPTKSIAGLPVISCAEFGRDVISYDISNQKNEKICLGNIFHMNHVESLATEISLQSLASHTFITGSTGSGKSNTVYKIIDEAISHNIKFLVIEPSKGEYKNVFGNDPAACVYSTNPNISPLLRLNPFSFPRGIHIYEHMDRLVEIFNVCWPMYAAMPAVLKSAIEHAYEDCGWDLINSMNPYGENLYPTFEDVARNIKTLIDNSEYDTENKGAYKGALLTRLHSLSNGINGLVFTTDELSPQELFESKTIVDLSRIGSSETKSLIMGMLVLKLQEHRLSNAKAGNEPLKHITVLEEAHNILKRTTTEQPVEGGNLVGKSVEMISNAIAEMRTYGEGFIIVDQAPGLMDMSVIRNTNTKIIMRLPDQGDRELVGKAANLDDEQIRELAKLPCGVAAIYQNEWIQPVLCKVDKVNNADDLYAYERPDNMYEEPLLKDRVQIAEMLSKGWAIGLEVSREYVIEKLTAMHLTDYIKVSVIKMMENPPSEPNMIMMAPIMNALFPEVRNSIIRACVSEADPEQWTRKADEILIKYSSDAQVRNDIIQGAITHYLLNETNNKEQLEKWVKSGGRQ